MIFGVASQIYESLGWSVAPGQSGPDSKKPIHKGIFGRTGSISSEQIEAWRTQFPDRNCLLRLEPGVVGIDVDDYWKSGVRKQGSRTLTSWESRLGGLPATYSSTSRGAGQSSRIYFFRLQSPGELISVLEPGGDVEIIQHHHRYAVVWPSQHPETSNQYRWYGPDGFESSPPKPSDLASLPLEWELALKKPSAGSAGLDNSFEGSVEEWLTSFDDGPLSRLAEELIEEFNSRPHLHVGHDDLLRWVIKAHRLQFKYRQSGARQVLDQVVETYFATTRDPRPEVELSNIIRWIIAQGKESE